MPCVLSAFPTAGADYEGTIGARFTVDVQCATAPVALVSAAYDTQVLTNAPFTFTIVAGVKNLAMIVEASSIGSVIEIVEACPGGAVNVLDDYTVINPDHNGSALRIKGV